jgi:hypothetical protein
MRYLTVLLLVLWAGTASAEFCYCDTTAMAPLASSPKIASLKLSRTKMSYYTDYKPETQVSCLNECRAKISGSLNSYKEEIYHWTTRLMLTKEAGISCTSQTDFKIPVKVRASLGEYSIGLAHQTIVFIHNKQRCYN